MKNAIMYIHDIRSKHGVIVISNITKKTTFPNIAKDLFKSCLYHVYGDILNGVDLFNIIFAIYKCY